MTDRKRWLAMSASVVLGGCCDKPVQLRVYAGALTTAQCLAEYQNEKGTNPPPVVVSCPGDPVTICWLTSKGNEVDITASPDPGGVSQHDAGMTDPNSGAHFDAVVFYPQQTTHVKVATSCESRSEDIDVLSGPTPWDFEGRFDITDGISYTVDPFYFDPNLQTTDVTAKFTLLGHPRDSNADVDWCSTTPFLDFTHKRTTPPVSASYAGSVLAPNTLQKFLSVQWLLDFWGYRPETCPNLTLDTDPSQTFQFTMTIQCPM